MAPFKMIGVIVAPPQVLRAIIGYQQTFPVMPAITKDIIVLLTFGCLLIFAQTKPFAMGVLDNAFRNLGSGQHAIARGFEEEAVVDVHQAIETETLVNPANLRQKRSAKCHEIAFDGIDIWSG